MVAVPETNEAPIAPFFRGTLEHPIHPAMSALTEQTCVECIRKHFEEGNSTYTFPPGQFNGAKLRDYLVTVTLRHCTMIDGQDKPVLKTMYSVECFKYVPPNQRKRGAGPTIKCQFFNIEDCLRFIRDKLLDNNFWITCEDGHC